MKIISSVAVTISIVEHKLGFSVQRFVNGRFDASQPARDLAAAKRIAGLAINGDCPRCSRSNRLAGLPWRIVLRRYGVNENSLKTIRSPRRREVKHSRKTT